MEGKSEQHGCDTLKNCYDLHDEYGAEKNDHDNDDNVKENDNGCDDIFEDIVYKLQQELGGKEKDEDEDKCNEKVLK